MLDFLFGLDKVIFEWCYNHCSALGHCFMLGAFEGAVFYLSLIGGSIVTVLSKRKIL